jgi:PAS domain S-box-containing protein/putative nucleotidyltransferase with HDIG domain
MNMASPRASIDETRQRLALLHILEDLKREHETAEIAHRQWLQTIDAVRDPMMVHDAEGRILRVNIAYARKAERGISDLLGKPYWVCFPRLEGALKGDEFTTSEGEIFLARSFPIHDADGEARSVLHVFEDVTERRKAAQEIEKREKRFRALIENGSDIILVVDAQGIVRFASPSSEALSGYPMEEILGKPFFFFLHPDDTRRIVDDVQALKAMPGQRLSGDFRFLTKDGRAVDLSATSKNALDDPTLRGIVVNARDVTERKQAERATARANRLYATLSGVNTSIVHAKSREALFQDVCRVAVARGQFLMALVSTYDAEFRSLGLLVQDGLSDEQFAQVREHRLPVAAANVSALCFRDNRVVWATDDECTGGATPLDLAAHEAGARGCAAVPIRCAGKPIGVLKLFASEAKFFDESLLALLNEMAGDIEFALEGFEREKARARAESHLRHSEERFRSYFEQGLVGMAITLPSKCIAEMNDRMCEIVGHSREDLLASGWATITHPEDLGRDVTEFDRVMAGEIDGYSLDKRFIRKDGRIVYTTMSVRCMRKPDRSVDYFLALIQDISERKEAEAKLRAALTGTIEAMAATLEARDPYTAGHQRRVADLAAAIAREMGLPADTVEGIHFGALIHDLGKVQVPAELLAKPTKLTKLEFELIKTHPQAGYEIVKNIRFPWRVAEMVHQHHERLDGSGYPQGLKGDAIAFEARVLAVADVVEAMASHRPYRPGLGVEKALAEIRAKRGTWFDETAVDACLALFRENRFSLKL